MTDFPDKPSTISQPAGRLGLRHADRARRNSIPRAQVPAFHRDFLNKPQALNHYQTMNRYWMEDSFGKYGVQLDAFGPYKLPGNSYQYFMTEFGGDDQPAHCPDADAGHPCNLNFRTDARAAWLADVGAAKIAEYDNIFYVSAGEDESATWQEFGEMKFTRRKRSRTPSGPSLRRPDPDQLGRHALRAVVLVGGRRRASGPTRAATRRSRPRPPAWRPTRTS